MGETNEYEKLFSIHDQTVATLKALRIPPYPANYKRYFDEIFIQQADRTMVETQKKEDPSVEMPDDLSRYLDLAHRSIASFVATHADISHVASLQQNYISKASDEGIERCVYFVDGLSELGKNMSLELKKAQQKIDELNAELQESLLQLTIDPLTRVSNRKGLMEDLENMLTSGETKTLPIVLLMIDADDFKKINDHHGHLAGDKVLYFLAQSIKSVIRAGDKVYRYGGEEFSVVLNRCDREQAFVVADKIRTKIEQSHLIYSGNSIQLTVSIGATIHREGDTYDEFVGRADDGLYRAKNEGKNKTILID